MEHKKLFFVDAETDGLYGSFITVAIIVTDNLCNEIERAYYGISKENLQVHDEWTIQHVVPLLGEYETCENEEMLLKKVWEKWQQYSDCAYAVGDVIYPVESRLFAKCIRQFSDYPMEEGPYPLLDMASILVAKGINPLISRTSLVSVESNEVHNAMFDIEVTVKLYKKLMVEV